MERRNVEKIMLKGASVNSTNFAGKEKEYNPAGKRNFCVEIPEDMVDDLKAEGWNIKPSRKMNEEQTAPAYHYLPVEARFDNYPPEIYMIKDRKRIRLTEDTVYVLDDYHVKSANVLINPRCYDEHHIKAYLAKATFYVEEDDFFKDDDYDDDDLPWEE